MGLMMSGGRFVVVFVGAAVAVLVGFVVGAEVAVVVGAAVAVGFALGKRKLPVGCGAVAVGTVRVVVVVIVEIVFVTVATGRGATKIGRAVAPGISVPPEPPGRQKPTEPLSEIEWQNL